MLRHRVQSEERKAVQEVQKIFLIIYDYFEHGGSTVISSKHR